MKALRPLLQFLEPLGVLPVEQEVSPGPVEELRGRYIDYLISERGLTSGTARGYVDFAGPGRDRRCARTATDYRTWGRWLGCRSVLGRRRSAVEGVGGSDVLAVVVTVVVAVRGAEHRLSGCFHEFEL